MDSLVEPTDGKYDLFTSDGRLKLVLDILDLPTREDQLVLLGKYGFYCTPLSYNQIVWKTDNRNIPSLSNDLLLARSDI